MLLGLSCPILYPRALTRDLKPDNITYTMEGAGAEPIIVDFGLAQFVDPTIEVLPAAEGPKGRIVGTFECELGASLERDMRSPCPACFI